MTTELTNVSPASVDERLLAHIINRPSGAREVFRRLEDSSQLEGYTNQRIFEACLAVFKNQNPAPMMLSHDMLVGQMQASGVYDSVDKAVVDRCFNSSVNARELGPVLDIVKQRSKTTRIDAAINELQQTNDASRRIEIAGTIAELSKESGAENQQRILTLDDWEKEIDASDEAMDCVPTSFPLLDRMLGGGWSKGGYHIVTSPPGSGKTILMLTAWKNMLDQGIPSLYMNYEIARGLFMKFMIAQFTGINMQQPDRYTAQQIADAKGQMKETVRDLYDRNLLLITDPMAGSSKYFEDMESMLTEFAEDYGAEAVFIDTINSIGARLKGKDRWVEYEKIARDSENLCQSLNIAVIYSAQMEKDAFRRDDKTPQLGDVAGSKVLTEKAASITNLLRTDIYYKKDGVKYSELHNTKNRSLGTELGTKPVRIQYDMDYKRLRELPAELQETDRSALDVGNETFLTPADVTGVKKHPTLNLDPSDGKEL